MAKWEIIEDNKFKKGNEMLKLLALVMLSSPLISYGANLPCSGNKGGVNHCEGSKRQW